MKDAILILEDGTEFKGKSFGAEGESIGELVFNTSMTGYQEILYDPSYKRQIVTMTYPEIGNTGINEEDLESNTTHLSGFIVKSYQDIPSNFRSKQSLGSFLKEKGIVAICGIDTRALTKKIRDQGAMMGIVSTQVGAGSSRPSKGGEKTSPLHEKLKKEPGMEGQDLVREVTCKEPYDWTEKLWALNVGATPRGRPIVGRHGDLPLQVTVYDFGTKFNILRSLVSAGCTVKVVPANTPAEIVLKENPDGIFLSNGPGDPAAVKESIDIVKQFIGKKPIFGICLGHQILSLALGAKTFKMKFGHHGANQPVKDLKTGKIEITSQNHGFAVDAKSLKGIAVASHVNLNDQTIEGIEVPEKELMSVQYHPEASPGPHDSHYLFQRFVEMMSNA